MERTRRLNGPVTDLSDEDIAEVCDVPLDGIRAMARRIQSALAPLLYRLYPVVVHLAGIEAAAPFDPDAAMVESELEAHDALVAVADRLGRNPDEVLHAALDASSIGGLQRALGLPLQEMNATLASLGVRYALIDYSGQHADDFADHLRSRRDQLL
jgi:hypothetical protein